MYEDLLREIRLDYDKKRNIAQQVKKLKTKEIYDQIPAIRRIDEDIFKTGLEISKAIIGNPDGYEEKVEEARAKIDKLKMEKAYILTESNIPLDYMEIEYECDKCKDTGYLENGKKCACLEQILVSKAYKMSNLENMLKNENFDTFDINIFSDEKFENESLTPRENMMDILSISEGFVNNFDINNGDNLLFYGTTGLGKTFMSNCIAKALLDKNKIVVYQTAFTILDILERRQFGKDKDRLDEYQYNLLFNSDLLIVDDLGTETSNTFTTGEIFNIINTRIIRGKKTIISSNLSPKEISDIYTDRIFSRILASFIPLKFYGKDLRWE